MNRFNRMIREKFRPILQKHLQDKLYSGVDPREKTYHEILEKIKEIMQPYIDKGLLKREQIFTDVSVSIEEVSDDGNIRFVLRPLSSLGEQIIQEINNAK